MPKTDNPGTAMIVGASRGLGLAMVAEYLKRGWHVIATVRGDSSAGLDALKSTSENRLEIEKVDITLPEQIAELRGRLGARPVDLLFVNAGVKNDDRDTIATVSTDEFVRVMVTNSLSPMRVIEALKDLVPATGTIGVMSSGQGSLTNNTVAQYEVYRSSKAALNMFMRSFANRHATDTRTFLLMAPGWVRTDMGGSGAHLSIDDSIPNLVDTIEAHDGKGGLHYVDYRGNVVPW